MKNIKLYLIILCSILCTMFLPCPEVFQIQTWKLFIFFCFAILGIVLDLAESYIVLLTFFIVAGLFRAITIDDSFTGFKNSTTWFLFIMLTISNVIKNTSIIQRITSIFIKLCGRNIILLSYGLCFLEFFFSVMVPSNAARASSLGAPIVSSLSKSIHTKHKNINESQIGGYLSILYRYCNSICSAAFLTGATANKIMLDIEKDFGSNITLVSWMKYTILPCIFLVMCLPFFVKLFINHGLKYCDIPCEINKDAESKFNKDEKRIILVFLSMLLLWFFSDKIHVSMMTTAVLGFVVMVLFGLIKKDDIVDGDLLGSCATIGLFLCFVDQLSSGGFFNIVSDFVKPFVFMNNKFCSLMFLSFIYICTKLIFNSECAGAVAFYLLFIRIGVSIGLDINMLAMSLAFFNSIGTMITHYSSTASPPICGLGYVSNKKWLLSGFCISCLSYLVWFGYLFLFENSR